MKQYLLGVDIGTSACKVALFSADGQVVSQALKDYNVYYPAPGHVEQDPDEWYQAVCHAIKECLASAKVDPKAIAGVGVDGQSWSAIPVDKAGKVLARTPIWMDTRAAEIAEKTLQRVGFERIFDVSGNGFEPTYSTPKMLWFKEHQPDVYRQVHRFLQSNSWIAYRLTGVMSQDKSQGYGVHAFDMKTGVWDEKLCDELGIDRAHLPEISACDQVIGTITAKAAAETGLASGTPVVAGGLDAACGTLGAGVIRCGQVQEQGGQAGGMSICMDTALAHPKLILSFHVLPDFWLLQGGTVGGGGALRWFRQELGAAEELVAKATGLSTFEALGREAAKVTPGADGVIFLPYMAGERSPIWDRNAKGVFYGLSYASTRAHMVRAVLEGCAFTLEHNLRTSAETGVTVNELVAMGGAANSEIWTQIKSDITGKRISVPSSDTATTLGAAILAGIGTGFYKSYEEAVAATIRITRVHEPDLKNHARYQPVYQLFREVYENLKETMRKQAEV
jgi:xylulokinase